MLTIHQRSFETAPLLSHTSARQTVGSQPSVASGSQSGLASHSALSVVDWHPRLASHQTKLSTAPGSTEPRSTRAQANTRKGEYAAAKRTTYLRSTGANTDPSVSSCTGFPVGVSVGVTHSRRRRRGWRGRSRARPRTPPGCRRTCTSASPARSIFGTRVQIN